MQFARFAACCALALASITLILSLSAKLFYGAGASAFASSFASGSTSAYFWPHARGTVGSYSVTKHVAPANLTAALSWSWHHPNGAYHTTVVGGPLIDGQRNIYLSTEDGVRKFNAQGESLWYYPPRGSISTCVSLMNGSVFGNTLNGWVFALDMATGRERWAEKKAKNVPGDTGYVESHDGVVVTGVDSARGGGATRVLGLDARNGRTLWQFKSQTLLWNIMPVFPGDDSFIVMDVKGGVYKHGLHSGRLLWKAAVPESSASFSDGGVMLGPDGTSYTCSNYEQHGQAGTKGVMRAFRLRDGQRLWERVLERPCNSWPVVSADGRSVVVPIGPFVGNPAASSERLLKRFGRSPAEMRAWSLALGNDELRAYGMEKKIRTAAIQAFGTRGGELLWSTELPPYGRMSARGDEEGYLVRRSLQIRDQCLPAQFGAPTISGDGTIYVGRADGLLYAVEPGTGKYRTFDTHAGFLHPGTSWAPGMMAVTSCDGLFVWTY